MWVDELGELLRVLRGSDVEELDLEHGGTRLTIRRAPTKSESEPLPTVEWHGVPSTESLVVTAPLVGIFRQSVGESDGPPVDEGDVVTAGQVVGAVEAMRLLNRIQAERSGVVEKRLVQDGQPVEFGQPLFVLRTA